MNAISHPPPSTSKHTCIGFDFPTCFHTWRLNHCLSCTSTCDSTFCLHFLTFYSQETKKSVSVPLKAQLILHIIIFPIAPNATLKTVEPTSRNIIKDSPFRDLTKIPFKFVIKPTPMEKKKNPIKFNREKANRVLRILL